MEGYRTGCEKGSPESARAERMMQGNTEEGGKLKKKKKSKHELKKINTI